MDYVEKYMYFSSPFDDHTGTAMQYGAHRPMDEVHGYTGSHWKPPSGEYSHPIFPRWLPWSSILAQKIKLWCCEGRTTIFDMRIMDTDARSYRKKEFAKVLEQHEK